MIIKEIFQKLYHYNFPIRLGIFLVITVIFKDLHTQFTITQFHGIHVFTNDEFIKLAPTTIILFTSWLYRKKLFQFIAYKKPLLQETFFLLLSLYFLFFPFEKFYYSTNLDIGYLKDSLIQGVSLFFLFLTIFGWKFFTTFKKQIFFTLLLIIPFSLSNTFIEIIWPQNFILSLNHFSVDVGPPCSGINSILIFLALHTAYLINLSNAGKSPNVKKIAISYLIGLISIFLLNILRIALIVLIGAYVSPTFAIGLFHSYIGSILILLFLYIFYRRLDKYIIR